LDLVVLMVLIEANIYFSFSGGFLYSRGGRGWTVLVEDHWVWTGLEWKKTEPNQTEINRFEPVFGSVRFGSKILKKIRFDCLFWFKTGPNRKCSALVSSTHIYRHPTLRPLWPCLCLEARCILLIKTSLTPHWCN
jgi:hypothetical protein